MMAFLLRAGTTHELPSATHLPMLKVRKTDFAKGLAKTPPCLGFTVVEAMLAITLTALASAALLQGLTSSMQTTEVGLEEAVARGVAEQLLDEITGLPYVAAGGDPYETTLDAPLDATTDRFLSFDESGDYNNLDIGPPLSSRGQQLGYDDGEGNLRNPKFQLTTIDFLRWRQRVFVYYVDENDPSTRLADGVTSNLRAVDVRIVRVDDDGTEREIARARRVISYVPSL